MIIALPNGEIYKASGNMSGVIFNGIDLNDAIVTHNHPPDNLGIMDSFSKTDHLFLADTPEIKELHAVT